jgi:hypothetical protein
MLKDWRSPLDSGIRLPQETLEHLQWCTNRDNFMAGVDIHPSQTVLVVYTDASMEGLGVHCTQHSAHGL